MPLSREIFLFYYFLFTPLCFVGIAKFGALIALLRITFHPSGSGLLHPLQLFTTHRCVGIAALGTLFASRIFASLRITYHLF